MDEVKRKPSKRTIAKKMRACLAAREAGKAGYAKSDQLLGEIHAALGTGKAVKLDSSGRTGEIVDQFAEKQVVYKPCGVRRYELKVREGAAAN